MPTQPDLCISGTPRREHLPVLLTTVSCICYICPMPEDKGSLNLRAIPISVIRRAKSAAALEGKTLRAWVIEAIQEKIGKAK